MRSTAHKNYDISCRGSGIVDEIENTFSYSYDLNNNLTTRKKPSDMTEQYAYNFRNLTTSMSSAGKTYSLAYNAAGEMTGIKGPDFQVQMLRDTLGQLTKMVFPEGDPQEQAYDRTGRLTKVSRGSSSLNYTYNNQGLVSTIASGNLQLGISYDLAGRKNQINYPNEIKKTLKYLANGLIKEEALLKQEDVLYKASYDYNKNGFMTKKTELINGSNEVTIYDYDSICRVIKAVYPDGEIEEFTYDADGNRVALNSQAFGNIRYEYDQAGQMVKMLVG
ncbi:MAG: hypothetical protein PHQ23_04480, partial [Candidatus Wallbacteria bacterium]|nr:hypothetical protein [Candidatus Wallbacteria bacterium]